MYIIMFNHDMPNLTRQPDLLYVVKCQSQFALTLPMYAFPIKWNIWIDCVTLDDDYSY